MGAALLFVASALLLAGCGGASDQDKITRLVEAAVAQPAIYCENATEELLKRVGGKESCLKNAETTKEGSDPKVESLDVNGDTATLELTYTVDDKKHKNDIALIKEGGKWRFARD